jgi:copper chaperone CopZ
VWLRAQPWTEISLTGIWCGSGIVRAKKAILDVAGVTTVKLDLPRSIAIVEGEFDQAAVVAIVKQIVQDGADRLARGAGKADGGRCG